MGRRSQKPAGAGPRPRRSVSGCQTECQEHVGGGEFPPDKAGVSWLEQTRPNGVFIRLRRWVTARREGRSLGVTVKDTDQRAVGDSTTSGAPGMKWIPGGTTLMGSDDFYPE